MPLAAKTVTPGGDLERLMPGSTKLKCFPGAGEFADAIIKHMGGSSGACGGAEKPKPAVARA